eukprot:TCONS_00050589-protein
MIRIKHRRCYLVLVLLLILLAWVHFKLLPSITDQYNTDCYLSEQSKKDLEILLKIIISSFEKNKVFYWLDYGSLLGAVRYHGIIPWDGDGDVSFLKDDPNVNEALRDINNRGVSANTMIATYGSASVDLVRWTEHEKTYTKYYPSWVKDGLITKISHKLEYIPKEFIGKRTILEFVGIQVAVPEKYIGLLKRRYRLSYWFSVPFKWKCYVPCFMKTDQSCDD